MKNKKLIIVLFLVFSIGCADRAPSYSVDQKASNAAPAATPARSASSESGDKKTVDLSNPAAAQVSNNQDGNPQTAPTVTERKIIRNADLTLEANAPEDVQQKITALAESKGGFVVETQQRSSSAEVKVRDTVTMTVRVPAEKFNESLDEIRKTGNRVVDETVKGQDVTEEFLDVEARLKTKKALEAQFLEIMKQGKTVEDALKVQRELANVRTEIEQIEGRKRFLENQSSLSTIKINIKTPGSIAPSSTGFFHKLGQAVSTGLDAALWFVLFFVMAVIALIPFFLLIVLPIYLLIRYLVRKSRKRWLAREIVREEVKEDIKNE